ncbi:RNA 2',3'-cyclic phosphodiesterase [Nocardioides sp. LHG3406-4]|uniref:RNA 2',3'-cyclic phosphodiesterase n=1 Tax=Nocardioides sp. LHG3406-4 TaxID=2804575 RepID=UPI003CF1815F
MTRMFAAAVPPDDVVEDLDDFLSARRAAAPFRWTLPEHWHVTLAFMAQVPDRSLDDLSDRLTRATAKRTAMTVRVAGGGAFPHPDRGRVLVAGLELDGGPDDVEELRRLAVGARAAAGKAGATVDGQRFHPHLTLARLGHPDNLTRWVRLLDGYRGPAWSLDEIALVASYLGEGPRKLPRYEVVETFRLAPGAVQG